MTLFFTLDEGEIDLTRPEIHVKDEYADLFKGPELRPFLRSELCVLHASNSHADEWRILQRETGSKGGTFCQKFSAVAKTPVFI